MAVQGFQVTLTGGVDAILTSGEILAKWLILQNNAAHTIRVGGKVNVTAGGGILLQAGGSINPPPFTPISNTQLSKWYAKGTSGDVLDVIYDEGVNS